MTDPKKKEKTGAKRKLREMENFAESAGRAHSDVLGSYTGVPQVGGEDEVPVQDADDL